MYNLAMINVAFVCLGNICRSPMAELIFKNMVEEEGLAPSFCITSFGTSDEEEGNPIYPPAKLVLNAHGIVGKHIARQLTLKDVINNDYILVMDGRNMLSIMHLTGGKFSEKVFRLCEFTSSPRDISDPYYTRDFNRAFCDIEEGCRGFLNYLKGSRGELLKYNKRH